MQRCITSTQGCSAGGDGRPLLASAAEAALTLEQLQALDAVGRAGSMAEAARRTNVPRTTLQRRIDELEAELGVTLVQRLANGVALTVHGQRLAERGRALGEELEALGDSVREDHDVSGVLRVAIPAGIHPRVLSAGTRMLFSALPQVRFRLLHGPHEAIPAEADVCIHVGTAPPAGPFVARTIARVPVRLLAGAALGRAPATVEEIAAIPLLFWSIGSAPPALPLVGGGELVVRPRVVSADIHFLHQAGREGLGLVWAPDGGFDEAPGVERLRPVLEDRVGSAVGVWLLLPEKVRPAPRIQEALRILTALVDLVPNTT